MRNQNISYYIHAQGWPTNQISGYTDVSEIPYKQKSVLFQFWAQKLRALFWVMNTFKNLISFHTEEKYIHLKFYTQFHGIHKPLKVIHDSSLRTLIQDIYRIQKHTLRKDSIYQVHHDIYHLICTTVLHRYNFISNYFLRQYPKSSLNGIF